jgi:hypothetical protein
MLPTKTPPFRGVDFLVPEPKRFLDHSFLLFLHGILLHLIELILLLGGEHTVNLIMC